MALREEVSRSVLIPKTRYILPSGLKTIADRTFLKSEPRFLRVKTKLPGIGRRSDLDVRLKL